MDEYSIPDLDVKSRLLRNNMAVYVVPRANSPILSVNCFVRTGSIHEGKLTGSGVSHFLEHMLFKGSAKFPGRRIAEIINGLGGYVNACTGFDRTRYYCELPAEHFKLGCEIIADMVSAPLLREEDFAAEKPVILRECAMCNDSPAWRGYLGLVNLVFPRHPAGIPIIGYENRLKNLSCAELVSYYRRRYAPERMFFVVGGNVEPEAVFQALEEYIGRWNNGELLELPLPDIQPNLTGRNMESIFDDEVARLYCGVKICDCSDADYFALALLSGIMGQNRSSILTKKLKREQKLALDISCQLSNLPNLEMLEICAVCEPDKVLELEAALRRSCREIIDNPPSEAMLTKEKQRLIFNYTHDLAGVDNMVSNAAGGVIFNGNPNFTAEFLRRVVEVDAEAVWRAAAKYLQPAMLAISRVVPQAVENKSSCSVGGQMKVEQLHGGRCAKFYISDSELPFVDIAMIIPGGLYFEDGNWGATQILRHLWCAGYADFDEEMVADYLDEHCLEFNSSCSSSHLLLTLNAPREKITEAGNFLQGILGKLRFDEAIFEREKQNLIVQSTSRLMDPLQAAISGVKQIFYPANSPYSHDSGGDPSELAQLTLDQVKSLYKRIFDPSRCVIGISGDIARPEADRLLNEILSAVNWSAPLPSENRGIKFNFAAQLEKQLPREQAAVVLGLPGFEFNSPDRSVFEVLKYGVSGFNSRLFKLVREENSLAYSTGIAFTGGLLPGMSIFYALVAPENVDAALDLLKIELQRLRTEGITETELQQGVAGAILECRQTMEYGSTLLSDVLLSGYYDCPGSDATARLARYRQMDVATVNRVLQSYFGGVEPAVVKINRKA